MTGPRPAAIVPEALPWMEDAACAGHNPEIWYSPGFPDADRDVWVTARTICDGCPSKTPCLTLALDTEDIGTPRHGMWGGLSPEERSALACQGRTA